MNQNVVPYSDPSQNPAPRYEIVDTVAQGDFATVYRARDRELGREVAIKAIHPQFLSDPRQLERYWREAQLLATLQHPNILTIYDIVRSRGWLIVELMRGSLAKAIETGPLDINVVRAALACSAGALQFLHGNGVIHGDIKPSNMLFDAQGRVKLGDFGLARRASNEQGSLLKGTTKYMAPELVSNQFGPVGPASDLYSLGFSCYELLCGPQFDSLFPGLDTFGRDRQIAWLMWHATVDRRLPPVQRVLEGVPDELARVIDRLTIKDQRQRYTSAAEVLQDLSKGPQPAPQALPVAASPVDKQKKLVRIAAISAFVISILVCVFMLLPGKQSREKALPSVVEGKIVKVDPDDRKMVVTSAADGSQVTVPFKPSDKFYLNFKDSKPHNLKEADEVRIETVKDDQGRSVTVFRALRPETVAGLVKELHIENRTLTVAVSKDGIPTGDELTVTVPATLKIDFNGADTLDKKPVQLANLQPDDRISVQYSVEENGRTARKIVAEREVEIQGVIREIDLAAKTISIETSAAEVVKFPYVDDVTVELNGSKSLQGKLLGPQDLKPDDQAVSVRHDSKVRSIGAYRLMGQQGKVLAVRKAGIDVRVKEKKGEKTFKFRIAEDCKITLGGDPVELTELRTDDDVGVQHDMPNDLSPIAKEIQATRPEDKSHRALVISVDTTADPAFKLPRAASDATLLEQTLVKRYAVPQRQLVRLANPPQATLRERVGWFFSQATADDQVIVYYNGHALMGKDQKVYLSTANFRGGDPAAGGVPLQWLVDQFEACPAKQKVLVLDACHDVPGIDRELQPSTAEMFASLKGPPGQAALRTVFGLASCQPGERGQNVVGKKEGAFAAVLVEGFSGKADENHDNQIEPSELFSFISRAISGEKLASAQTPKLILPDNRPPRLTEEAKKAIRALATVVRSGGDQNEAKTAFGNAQGLAGKEVEPRLLYGLALLRSKNPKQRAEAVRYFEDLKSEKPELLLPLQVLAWGQFEKRQYSLGVEGLAEFVAKIPKPGPKENYSPAAIQTFQWVGQLREFAPTADDARPVPKPTLDRLDAAVADHGDAAKTAYSKGRQRTQGAQQAFDDKVIAAEDEAMRSKLKIDRKQVSNFVVFPFDEAIQSVLETLDQ